MAHRLPQTNKAFAHLGDVAGASVTDQYHQPTYETSPPTGMDGQAAAKDVIPANDNASNGVVGPRPHPTLRLSHIQHPTTVEMPRTKIEKTSAEKSKYHQAVSRNTESRFNEQLAKSFALPLGVENKSRDGAQSKAPSLAATHPANYQTLNKNKLPPMPASMQSASRASLSPNESPVSVSSNSSSSRTEPPWRVYTDPKWQTSDDPHYWDMNRTTLKADTNALHGNVISPTWMVGLPFGSMTEMAECYPMPDEDGV